MGLEYWINPCPASHYNARDTRHVPFLNERYAEELSESTSRHTMKFMRELAALKRREGQANVRSTLQEDRESIVQRMWSAMGPGSAEGHTRELADEELRLMTVMMCQGDWPPEMVEGANRHEW
jgi:hypothetical protein